MRITIEITDELHHFLKVHTAYKKDTIMNFVREAIYDKVNREKEPNKETIKILEKSKRGLNITKFNSIEELYRDLEIE